MRNTKFIKRMLENRNKKELNKPKYKISDLYIGQLVLLKDATFVNNDIISNQCDIIKEFAIFYYDGIEYTHISSNAQHLKELNPLLVPFGELAVHNLKPLKTYVINLGYSADEKVSKRFINELENNLNNKITSMQYQ